MKYILFFVITLHIYLLINQVECMNRYGNWPGHRNRRNVCKPIIEQNFTSLSPKEISEKNLKLVIDAWNERYPTLTCEGNALKRAILKMANCTNPKWNTVAQTVSAWTWSHIPQILHKPNMCPFAKVINETVNHKRSNDNSQSLKKAIDLLSVSVMDAGSFMTATALKNAGCDPIKPKLTASSCYADGKIYLAEELWNLHGAEYPEDFKKAALSLYKSNKYLDQLMGAIATSSICGGCVGYYENYHKGILFAFFDAQLTERIPYYCCELYQKDIEKYCSRLPNVTRDAAEGAKKAISCLY